MNAPRDVVQAYFKAMQAGPDGGDALFALFADDAVYTEPFSGEIRTHSGRSAIEAYLRGSWVTAPPDLVLTVDRIDVEGAVVTSLWTCDSPIFERPMRGQDVCTVRDGRITRLHVTFLA